MEKRCHTPSPAALLAGGVAIGVASYAAYVATTWSRYGKPKRGDGAESLLDSFIPQYEVGTRHHLGVNAPADVTFGVACGANMNDSAIISSLFRIRELIFGHPTIEIPQHDTLVEQVKAFGWVVLADVPGREIVFGSVTQPWKANAIFRPVPPDQFAAFNEPGYVKIVWTLRADPVTSGSCTARTDTRVATTDASARARFRWYWSCLSPGIKIIRMVMLRRIKAMAERQAMASIEAVA